MFHPTQIKAIQHDKGPALVLAGPGSGKTTVITNRIKYLTQVRQVPMEHILVITFTKAAATEMEHRYYQLVNQSPGLICFGTFHSVFFRILKFAYHYNGNNILRESERLQIMEELLQKHYEEAEVDLDVCTGVLAEISNVKNNRLDSEEYPSGYPQFSFGKVYHWYNQELRNRNKIDFDDMLLMTWELLTERPDILGLWQEKYQYILIDEFQDINQVQYDVVRMLAGTRGNIFVVGDDDQSIYGFRGSRPDLMLGFERDFPDMVQITLRQNYRSSPGIVMAAEKVICQNRKRFAKKITAVKTSHEVPVARLFESPQRECNQVAEEIHTYIKNGVEPSEIAVLTRTNTGARLLVEYLVEKHIPFHMRDSVPNLFSHWVCRPIFAYLSWMQGNHSRNAFLRIMNCPNRYIRRGDFSGEEISLEQLKKYYSKTKDRQWMVEKIDFLDYQLTMLQKMKNPYAMVNYIRKGMEYDRYVKEYAEYKHMDAGELLEMLDSLQESAKEFSTVESWYAHITEVTKTLEKAQKSNQGEKGNEVILSTLHSSKGLEFSVVYLLDCNETVMPHEKSTDRSILLEEERRLFYVGMTRAISHLHLYAVRERYGKPVAVSRFLKETGIQIERIMEE